MSAMRRIAVVLSCLAALMVVSACSDGVEEVVDPAFAIRGKRVANRCVACHALERRDNKVGPHLVGVVGREVAVVRGFDYSEPMKTYGGTWSRERLQAFLRDPQVAVPGTRMAVSPMNEVELEGLLVYLESLQ